MHFKTFTTSPPSRSFRDWLKPTRPRFDGTLSRRDLQRIVAELLG